MTDFKEFSDTQKHWKDYDAYAYRSEIISRANLAKRRSKTIRDLVIFLVAAVFALAVASVSFAGEQGHSEAAKADAPKVFDSAQPVGVKATCPVMGDTFTIKENTPHQEYKGKHVYFCCPACEGQFKANPEKYIQ